MSDDSFQKLSHQITQLGTHLAERIDGLQNAIGELRDELAVNLRAGERIERAGAESRLNADHWNARLSEPTEQPLG